jgi:hypothetical protein
MNRLCALLIILSITTPALADDIGPELPTFAKGFNSLANVVRGECITLANAKCPTPELPNPDVSCDPILNDWSDFIVIESMESLKKTLDLSAGASFGIGIYSGDARYSLYSSADFNHYSSYLLIHVVVRKQLQTLVNRQPTDLARWANSWGSGKMFETCGNKFLAQRQTGGLFYTLLEVEGSSEQEQKEVSGAFNAAAGPWGSANASLVQTALSKVKTTQIHYHIEKIGVPEGNPDRTIDAVLPYGLHFPEKIYNLADEKAAPIQYDPSDWSTLGYGTIGAAQIDIMNKYSTIFSEVNTLQNDLAYIVLPDHIDWFTAQAIGEAQEEKIKVDNLATSIVNAAKDCAQFPDMPCIDPATFRIPQYNLPRRPHWVEIDPLKSGFQPVDIVLPGETRHLDVKGTYFRWPGHEANLADDFSYEFIGDDGQLITNHIGSNPNGYQSGAIVFSKPGKVFVKLEDTYYADNAKTPEGAWASLW